MTHRLVNTCTRPVELHLTVGTVVVPAMGTVECSASDLAQGQVVALVGRGVLASHEAGPPPPDPPKPPPRRPRRSRRSKA